MRRRPRHEVDELVMLIEGTLELSFLGIICLGPGQDIMGPRPSETHGAQRRWNNGTVDSGYRGGG